MKLPVKQNAMSRWPKTVCYFAVALVAGGTLLTPSAWAQQTDQAKALGWIEANQVPSEQQKQRPGLCGGYYLHEQYNPPVVLDSMEVSADQAEYLENGGVRLKGNVSALSQHMLMRANEAEINKTRTAVLAEGNVRVLQENGLLLGEKGRFNQDNEQFEVNQAQYLLYGNNFRGGAIE